MSLKSNLTYFLAGAITFGLGWVITQRLRELRSLQSYSRAPRTGATVDPSAWALSEVVDVDTLGEEAGPPAELVIDSSVIDAGFVDSGVSNPDDVQSTSYGESSLARSGVLKTDTSPKAEIDSGDPQSAQAPEDLGVAWLSRATQTPATQTPPDEPLTRDRDSLDDVTDFTGRPTDPMLGEIFATGLDPDRQPGH